MTIIQFLQFFLIITAFGTLAVTGWYFITRGDEETLPDGSKKRTGKIFMGWYFFWTKEKSRKKKIFYQGEQLQKLVAELRSNYLILDFDTDGFHFTVTVQPGKEAAATDISSYINDIEKKWDIKIKGFNGLKHFKAYKEYPEYVFPELVRTPLATCATCFSSIYGSIFYWGAVSLVQQKLFDWSYIPWLAAVFFWGVFCFALSVLNTALAKSFN